MAEDQPHAGLDKKAGASIQVGVQFPKGATYHHRGQSGGVIVGTPLQHAPMKDTTQNGSQLLAGGLSAAITTGNVRKQRIDPEGIAA